MGPWPALVVCATLLLSGCLTGDYTHASGASHEWRATIHPETSETYIVDIPFLIAHNDKLSVTEGLEALRLQLASQPGTHIQWIPEPEGYLRVTAEGPTVLEAKRTFSGSVGEREAFTGWSIAGDRLESHQGGDLVVTWSVDFSGGRGHTCWQEDSWTVTVPSQQEIHLEPGTASDSVVCA